MPSIIIINTSKARTVSADTFYYNSAVLAKVLNISIVVKQNSDWKMINLF